MSNSFVDQAKGKIYSFETYLDIFVLKNEMKIGWYYIDGLQLKIFI